MIKLNIPRKDFLLKRSLNVQFVEFANSEKI